MVFLFNFISIVRNLDKNQIGKEDIIELIDIFNYVLVFSYSVGRG